MGERRGGPGERPRKRHAGQAPGGPPRPARAGKSGSGVRKDDLDAVAYVLGQLAHDLRTPLGSLALWLPELREECTRAGVAGEILPLIEGASRALTFFAQDLDDAAQILQGNLKVNTRSVELRSLLESVGDRLRRRAEAKGVELRLTLGREPVHVAGDPERLDRLFDALVKSSVGAASGGSAVEALLRVEGEEAIVSIAPPPVGAEGLPRLRERLVRPTPGRGNLGLALALARHFLEAHRAGVDVGTSDLRVRLALARRS